MDAYECRTGIEEGGVKKTIVVSNEQQWTEHCSSSRPDQIYKKSQVRYACCHGYQRANGEPVCSKVTKNFLSHHPLQPFSILMPIYITFTYIVKGHHEISGGDCEGAKWSGVFSNGRGGQNLSILKMASIGMQKNAEK